MAETQQGRVAQSWKAGDPRPGYYYLHLKCEFCGASNGYIYPEAGAPPLGSRWVNQGGEVGICQRCGKDDRCIVMSKPKAPPAQEQKSWSW